MKSGRAKIGIFQKIRIKNLMRGQWGPILKKLDSFTLETSKNHLIRSFLRNGRLRVKRKNNFESKLMVTQKRIITMGKTYVWNGVPVAGTPSLGGLKFSKIS